MKRALIAFSDHQRAGHHRAGRSSRAPPGATATRRAAPPAARSPSRSRTARRAGDVAARLKDAGLIGNPTVFRLYAGQRGVAGRFKAGRYEIAAPATPKQILDTLVKGAADELVTVVVPEGKNLLEVAEILAAAGVAGKAELAAKASDPAFAARAGRCRATRSRAICSPTPTGCVRTARRRAR